MTLEEAKKIIAEIKQDPSKGLQNPEKTAEAIKIVSGAAIRGL